MQTNQVLDAKKQSMKFDEVRWGKAIITLTWIQIAQEIYLMLIIVAGLQWLGFCEMLLHIPNAIRKKISLQARKEIN